MSTRTTRPDTWGPTREDARRSSAWCFGPASGSRARAPSDADVAALHHEAHEICFLANSVTTDVVVEPAESP